MHFLLELERLSSVSPFFFREEAVRKWLFFFVVVEVYIFFIRRRVSRSSFFPGKEAPRGQSLSF